MKRMRMCKQSCWYTTRGQAFQVEHEKVGANSIRQVHKAVLDTCKARTASALQFSLPTRVKGISTNHKQKCSSRLLVLHEASREGWQLEVLDLYQMNEQVLLWSPSPIFQADLEAARDERPVPELHKERLQLE